MNNDSYEFAYAAADTLRLRKHGIRYILYQIVLWSLLGLCTVHEVGGYNSDCYAQV